MEGDFVECTIVSTLFLPRDLGPTLCTGYSYLPRPSCAPHGSPISHRYSSGSWLQLHRRWWAELRAGLHSSWRAVPPAPSRHGLVLPVRLVLVLLSAKGRLVTSAQALGTCPLPFLLDATCPQRMFPSPIVRSASRLPHRWARSPRPPLPGLPRALPLDTPWPPHARCRIRMKAVHVHRPPDSSRRGLMHHAAIPCLSVTRYIHLPIVLHIRLSIGTDGPFIHAVRRPSSLGPRFLFCSMYLYDFISHFLLAKYWPVCVLLR